MTQCYNDYCSVHVRGIRLLVDYTETHLLNFELRVSHGSMTIPRSLEVKVMSVTSVDLVDHIHLYFFSGFLEVLNSNLLSSSASRACF